MGLDTYATRRGADGEWELAPDEPFAAIQLCGGLCSGGTGSSSIRGKVYDRVVRWATGESLYQERIEPDRVAAMAVLLRVAVDLARGDELDEHDVHPGEVEDLARWFEVCAERGYAVEGWW